MVVETALDVVSTIGLWLVTVTVSSIGPSASVKSTTFSLPTRSVMPLRTTERKPVSDACTS